MKLTENLERRRKKKERNERRKENNEIERRRLSSVKGYFPFDADER